MQIHGSCHCRNIAFTLDWEPDPERIPARACDCSFCTRHGATWTASPDAELELRIASPALVSEYAFGTGTAVFHICARCGCVPVVTSRIDQRLYAVVNVTCFTDFDPARLNRSAVSLEGEDEAARLARRQRNWIAQVHLA